MTTNMLAVLAVFLEDPTAEWYGFDLSDRANVKTGTLYPLLARLEEAGWLTSRFEGVDPRVVGRPRRRFYVLTGVGKQAAREELDRHLRAIWPVGPQRRPKPATA